MLFLLGMLFVLGGIPAYLWLRLLRTTTTPSRVGRLARRWGAVAIAVLTASVLAALIVSRTQATESAMGEILVWLGYVWLALMFYLVVWLVPFEALWGTRALIRRRRRRAANRNNAIEAPTAPDGKPTENSSAESEPTGSTTKDETEPPPEADVSRRTLLVRGVALAVGVGAASTVGYGMTKALSDPVVERVPITLRKLDSRLSGFRIGLISDIHIGPIIDRNQVAHAVAELNRAGVDLVTVVGDLVDGSVKDLGDEAAPLADLKAPHGTYFVTGNHEYYSGVEEWVEFLPSLGIRVLRNERVTITREQASFELAGVNDISADTETYGRNGSDLTATLRGRDAGRPLVLLAHQPVMFPDAARGGVDLQLSGHTHGGQLAPFDWLVQLEQGAVSGKYRRGKSQLYVTRGLGFWGPPVRVLAPPEITIIELRAP